MKIGILCLLLLCSSWETIAQTDQKSKYHWGVHVNLEDPLLPYNAFHDLNKLVSVMGTLGNDHHRYDLGVTFAPLKFPQFEFKMGIRLGYTFYPNGQKQRFNSYLRCSIPVQFVKDSPVSYIGVSFLPIDGEITNNEFWNIHLQGGYGIQLNLSQHLYLGSDISILYGMHFRQLDYFNDKTDNSGTYNDWYVSLYPQIGLNFGYRF